MTAWGLGDIYRISCDCYDFACCGRGLRRGGRRACGSERLGLREGGGRRAAGVEDEGGRGRGRKRGRGEERPVAGDFGKITARRRCLLRAAPPKKRRSVL
jgi:hypothetical protein